MQRKPVPTSRETKIKITGIHNRWQKLWNILERRPIYNVVEQSHWGRKEYHSEDSDPSSTDRYNVLRMDLKKLTNDPEFDRFVPRAPRLKPSILYSAIAIIAFVPFLLIFVLIKEFMILFIVVSILIFIEIFVGIVIAKELPNYLERHNLIACTPSQLKEHMVFFDDYFRGFVERYSSILYGELWGDGWTLSDCQQENNRLRGSLQIYMKK